MGQWNYLTPEKTVVIFGATGSIGAYATLDIQKKGFIPIAVGFRKNDNHFFLTKGITYISLDIKEKKNFFLLPKQVYAVVNLAGAMPAKMKIYNPQEYIDSITTGTLNVLEYCVRANAKKIVFSQSISDIIHLYGSTKPIPADCEMKFPLNNDHSIYSICKNAAVNLIEHYHAKYGLKRYILRFPNIYLYHPNPYYYVDGTKKMQSYRYLIEQAMKGESIEMWGDPNIQRDIVYVKDCVQIITKALQVNAEGGIYNVGTGVGTSFRKQIEGIIDIFSPENKKSKIIECPQKENSPQYILDISKTEKELGYQPKYDYISYLIDFKNEMQKEPFKNLWGTRNDYSL